MQVMTEEKRVSQKYKAKASIHALGLRLAKKLYPMAETTVDDVIERLFTEKAYDLDLLTEDELKALPNELKTKTPVQTTSGFVQAVETVPVKTVPLPFKPSNTSVLPLGEVQQKRG